MNVSFENVIEVRKQILFLQVVVTKAYHYAIYASENEYGHRMYIRVNGKDYKTNILDFLYLFCQILEAAHRIGASDMKKHALDLVVGHFVKVIKTVRGGPDGTLPWSPRLGDLRRTNHPAL